MNQPSKAIRMGGGVAAGFLSLLIFVVGCGGPEGAGTVHISATKDAAARRGLPDAGCEGTWAVWVGPDDGPGVLTSWLGTANGLIYTQAATRLASITDGTSNTIRFGEHAHGNFGGEDSPFYFGWNSGYWGDTFFDTSYPINAYRKLAGQLDLNDPTDPYGGWWWVPVQSASSFHPGGANFAFADGSAHFIKDSIATWQNNPNNFGDPVGVSYGPNGQYLFGSSHPQIYQYLSTRNVGEVISSDTY